MKSCCNSHDIQRTPTRRRRPLTLLGWVGPGVVLALLPKCPMCLAAYVAIWTGLGLSLAAATYLRWSILVFCVVTLMAMAGLAVLRKRANGG